MYNKLLLTLTLLFFISLVTTGQRSSFRQSKSELRSEIDSILESRVRLDEIPGAVMLIKEDNRIVYRHAFGYAQKYDYDHRLLNPPEKMTVSCLFDIASLTKVIGTTTAIMLLVDRGMIHIEDPVCRYIKAFDTPEKNSITIRHLFTHTAGLYEWYPLYYLSSDKKKSYQLISELPLKFPVGEQRRYSDLGFVLLGQIVEIVSGLPLEKFMQQNIFVPLRMKNTGFNPLKEGRHKKIAATSAGNPYEKRMVYDSTLGYKMKEIDPASWNGWRTYVLKGEVNDGNAWYAFGGISGAAGLFSTADDLEKLVDMLLNNGKAGSKQFLSPAIIETFLTKDKFNNALGWMMDPANSFMRNAPEGSFGHSGFTGPSISAIPQKKISVIFLINRQNTGIQSDGEYYNVNQVRRDVFGAVLKYLVRD
jgi:serine-type D-Ala-D-Ala carboxypeptidase